MIIKYLMVVLSSSIKFIGGPLVGVSSNLNTLEIAFFTMLGMMCTVSLLSYFGNFLRKNVFSTILKRRKRFTPKNRRIVILWRRYGLHGIAFLTPIVLTPPIGTLIAVSFGEEPLKIISFMWISAIFWAILLSTTFKLLSERLVFFLTLV